MITTNDRRHTKNITNSKLSDLVEEACTMAELDIDTSNEQLIIKNKKLEVEVKYLKESVKYLTMKIYGRKSEVLNSDQLHLGIFNEAESEAISPPSKSLVVKEHTRTRKSKKDSIPKDIERRQTILDLNDDQKKCIHDGSKLVLVGTKKTEKLEVVPAQFYIHEIIENLYECSHCDEKYSPENLNLGILPTTLASPSLLSFLVTSKYCDALPLYRLEKIFAREDIFISRQTFARWIITLSLEMIVLINILRDMLIDSHYIRIDETTIQVNKEENRKAHQKSYMWVQYGMCQNDPITVFDYRASRGGEVPIELLEGFEGYLQADAYCGYKPLVSSSSNKIIRVGCWDHCRRGFVEVYKLEDGKGISNDFIFLIKKLYKIEHEIKGKPTNIKYSVRQKESIPVLEQFVSLAKENKDKFLPKSKIGKAINYAINEWKHLTEYVKNGDLEISNIMAENAIRPFAIGRKNWLFSDTTNGADASAILYSLASTAMANNIPPGIYFKEVCHLLPHCETIDDFEKLLPLKSKFAPRNSS